MSLSNVVVIFCRFDWPGVGAWKPVLTDPRKRDRLVQVMAKRELAVERAPEVGELLVAQARTGATRRGRDLMLDLAVHGDVVAREAAGVARFQAL